MSHAALALLWPRPREATATGEAWPLPAAPAIDPGDGGETAPGARRATAERLARALAGRGLAPRVESPGGGRRPADLRLVLDPAAGGSSEAYRLLIGPSGVTLTGAGEPGLFHAVSTLIQWLELHPEAGAPGGAPLPGPLPGLAVADAPDLPHRGVMLDVSRDKVPTMETLLALVDRLAAWKVNQLQLYFEHTFAYRGHEVVWREASPFTAEEVRRLDAFCRERHVELVPNQNSFGHFHRWLVHEPYRRLAECPEGIEHPFSPTPEPFSLCPLDPGCLDLLAGLYDQLLPCFTSRQLNVGLDETFDLGRCRSAAAVAERGRERVYLDYLLAVHRLVAERGHRMQFWGDIILARPDLLGELPGDAVALEWGYEADHPFAEHAGLFAASGLPLLVCPGTSSWNSLGGRSANALANLASAATHGRAAGAEGLLVTDWGDFGHLQPLPVSYLGLLAGAGFAWNVASAATTGPAEMAELLDAHAFADRAGVLGRAAWELGEVHRATGTPDRNGTALFFLLLLAHQDLDQRRFRGLSAAGLEAALEAIDSAVADLPRAASARLDAATTAAELAWVADLLRLACRLGLARLAAGTKTPVAALPSPTRRELATALAPLIERHRELWHARNRPGGRADSAARLERLHALLAG